MQTTEHMQKEWLAVNANDASIMVTILKETTNLEVGSIAPTPL